MFWLFPGFPVTFRVFTTRSVYSKEPLAVLQTNHDPVPIIYLNIKLPVMKRKFTHKQIIVGVIVTAYLTMLIGGIVTVLSNLDSVSYGIY